MARQFEALFLQMMLKSMRDAVPEGGLFDSNGGELYQEMHDKQLSVTLSEQGGIGLARMMVEQMQTRDLVPKLDDDTNGELTAVKTSAEQDVTQVFGPKVANAYDIRSDD